MKCEICGAEIPEGYKYCPVCGDPVFDVDVTAKSDESEDSGEKELETGNKPQKEIEIKAENKTKRKQKKDKTSFRVNKRTIKALAEKPNFKKIIGFAALAIVAAIFVFRYFADAGCFYDRYLIVEAKVDEDIEEPSIDFIEGMFFASNGRCLRNSFTRKLEITSISYNEFHTKAVFLRGDECYYIDGRLKPKRLAAKSDFAVMSKKGTKAYFNDLKEGCVSVYDSATGKITKIADNGTMARSCVSGDGNTLALYAPEDKSITVFTPDKAPVRIVSGLKNLCALAVSDDGKRVIYRTYSHDIFAYYFYNDKKTTTISTGYYLRECINYDVTELIAFYRGAIYFKSGMESGVTLSNENFSSVVVRGEATTWVDGNYSVYYVDVDSFEPSLLKDEDLNVYYFYDHDSDLKKLDISGLGADEIRLVGPDMDSVLCKDEEKLSIYTISKDGIKKEAIEALNGKEVYNYSYNDDASVIWASTYDGELYFYKNGSCEKLTDGIRDELKYDKATEKTFFIKDHNLYSVKDSMDSMTLEMEGCRFFSWSFEFDDYVEVMGDDGFRYAYIYGNLVKED